jgi:hypothetical protein
MIPPNPNFRPPFYPPAFMGGNEKIRPMMPMPTPNIKPISNVVGEPMMEQHPPDKIVKDQNFLNSDDKLFESIVNSEMSIRNLYEDVQISETHASSILYKTIKKLVHDPNTVIFEENSKKESKEGKESKKDKDRANANANANANDSSDEPKIKNGEILKHVFEDFLFQNSDRKRCINFGDMSDIRQALINNRNIANSQNNI